MSSLRILRLEKQLHSLLSTYFVNNSSMFSEIQGFLSVVSVQLTADLRFAKVFVSFYSQEELSPETLEKNLAVLKQNQNFLQKYLGKNWTAKNCPHIERWVLDKSLDAVDEVYRSL